MKFIPYELPEYSSVELISKSGQYLEFMNKRRTVREFSDREVPAEVIQNIIMTASTAPSGAHRQPWTFCAVSDKTVKSQIRKAAEEEEYESYHGRMPQEWLDALKPFGTDWQKPFLEIAPWLIIIFKKPYDIVEGRKVNNYYVNESTGIAAGFLLAAIYNAGLAGLTHTPSPMNFLGSILKRPENERPFLLIPVGYLAESTKVPDLKRKPIEEVAVFYS